MRLFNHPIRFGNVHWIMFVRTRDEMLRSERPAMVCGESSFNAFTGIGCPVCGTNTIENEGHWDAFGDRAIPRMHSCPGCKSRFEERRHVEVDLSNEFYCHWQRRHELWLVPGTAPSSLAFPRRDRLPNKYPKQLD